MTQHPLLAGLVLFLALHASAQNRPWGLMTDLLKHTDRVFMGGYPSSVRPEDAGATLEPVQTAEILSEYPSLSWIVPDNGKNTRQKAYRIVLSEILDDAEKSEGNVWDSGWVYSSESVSVKYRGMPLIPGKLYCWRVKVITDAGGESHWSGKNFFRTGNRLETYQPSGEILVKSAENPVACSCEKNVYFFDFGKASFGQLLVKLSSETGNDTVTVNLGEKASNGRVDATPGGTIRYRSHRLILQKGTHLYRIKIDKDKRNTLDIAVKMPYYIGEVMPFRYAEILNYSKESYKTDVIRETVHYPFDDSASFFRSDNDTLNQIWEMCRYTMKATSFTGVYIDGDRERIPYEADILINQLSHYAVDRTYSIARESLEYILKKPTWPTEWILQAPLIAWYDYMYTGDSRTLEKNYELLKSRTLMQLTSGNGLVTTTTDLQTTDFLKSIHSKQPIRDIVDWPGSERDSFVFCRYNSVVNAFYYEALKIMKRIAHLLGKREDLAFYSNSCKQVYKTFNETFFDLSQKLFTDGDTTAHASLHANMFAAVFGLVPQKYMSGIQGFLKSKGMACSVYGAQFLMEALYENGNGQYAETLLTSTAERSWYNMLRSGSTVALEAWDRKYKPNLDWNHAWGAAPANIIARYVVGIKPSSPGFENICLKPHIYNLSFVNALIPTIRGGISFNYRRTSHNEYMLSVEIPPNMRSDVYLPIPEGKFVVQVFLDDQKIDLPRNAGKNKHLYVGKLNSGKHSYRMLLK